MTVTRRRLLFALIFLAAGATAVALVWSSHLHEAATIILFAPLLWAFVAFSPRGMLSAGVLVAMLRIWVEAAQLARWQGQVDPLAALHEAVFPLLLYLVLGLVFYAYRSRQAKLVSQLVEAGTVEARDRLAGSLAHDFNNIVTLIDKSTQALLTDRSLSPQARLDATHIAVACEQGSSLVRQLRSASRGNSSNQQELDLAELVDQQMDLIQRALPPNIHVVRYSGGALPVKADKGQMLRVLLNLCLNARNAMPQGGVLKVKTARQEFHGRPYAALVVSDTGDGIDPGIMDRLFEPFFTKRSSGAGIGLGLSIVKAIALAHGGHVEARNVPNSGAAFSVLLPTAA